MPGMDLRNSVGIRLVIIVVLTFVLLIPSIMIKSLITERQERRDSVAQEISRNWGAKQTLVGPVLNIPYKVRTSGSQQASNVTLEFAHFLPDRFDVNGVITPELRNRGIYRIVVYNGVLDLSATFGAPQFAEFNVNNEDVMWKDAWISLGITDMKGVKDPVQVHWNDHITEANPGDTNYDLGVSGLRIPVAVSATTAAYTFRTNLNLNGSFDFLLSPVGKETTAHLSSPWSNPSFTGDYLPVSRDVSDKGFQSDWRVLQASRGFPQQWSGSKYELSKTLFGVSLLMAVDQYQQTMRTVKYAIMFIGLTFLTFFVMEILSARPIHPVQYLFIGFALMLFYTLLLSLSEYIAFGSAYLVACVGIVSMIALYSRSVLVGWLRSGVIAVVLSILYGYLYVVLQLQDYALLMGTLILFVALALLMFLTRRIDWFSILNYRNRAQTDSLG